MVFSFVLFKIGVIAGLGMALAATALKMIHFTTLDLTKYFGALLTGQIAGRTNIIAGCVFHLLAAGIWAQIYFWIIIQANIPVKLISAIQFGVVHTIISGLMLPMVDRLNPCVAHKTLRPLGYFASNYGATAVLTYVVGHVLYAILVFKMKMPVF